MLVLKGPDSTAISTIIKELKSLGYQVGLDFDFEFSTSTYDYETMQYTPRKTKFTFYNLELATWFNMKYM